MPAIPIERIRAAAERARPYVRRTSLLPIGGDRYLKLECLQPTGSFKVRGFAAQALTMPAAQLERGLLTVSAGNAAAACAYVAHRLGVACRAMMFDTAPPAKVAAVKRWGGVPVFLTREQLLGWMGSEGWRGEPEAFVHPFAGEELMAGHGGVALEIVQELPDVARVIVPVGGGGLATGIGSALAALAPRAEVIGAQSDGYPLWPRSLAAGRGVSIAPSTIADGTTAPWTESMVERVTAVVHRWIEVPEQRLRRAVAELATDAKIVAEGAGALAFAALDLAGPSTGPTVAVISGGNIDPRLLASLLSESVASSDPA